MIDPEAAVALIKAMGITHLRQQKEEFIVGIAITHKTNGHQVLNEQQVYVQPHNSGYDLAPIVFHVRLRSERQAGYRDPSGDSLFSW